MGSIIIALPRKDTAGKIKEILLRHGFRDVAVVPTAAAALQETGRLSHGIIISGTKLSDMDYTDLLNCLPRYFDLLLLDTTQNVSYRRLPLYPEEQHGHGEEYDRDGTDDSNPDL